MTVNIKKKHDNKYSYILHFNFMDEIMSIILYQTNTAVDMMNWDFNET
jgi:hypothetical protein